ncbi:Cut9-interacting protein scn1 [Dispira parvispora]|uniref:Cut9-interacting protein scn1 n=1 Tax=Dispira parvispora TaxID=1520584 RepID=A0A9W8APF9_9FUNG|nr:Cut9-interacting protein scn1 [Dispira parvispora]
MAMDSINGDEDIPWMLGVFDVHNHVQQDSALVTGREEEQLEQVRTRWLALMGYNRVGWNTLESLLQLPKARHRIVVGFGIHPWAVECTLGEARDSWIKRVQGSDLDGLIPQCDNDILAACQGLEWYQDLVRLLNTYPNAIVGEIGLDRMAVNRNTGQRYDYRLQWLFFRVQWDLAVKLHRPVSLHCVRAATTFVAFIQQRVREWQQQSRGQRRSDKIALSDQFFPTAIMLHSYSGSTEVLRQIYALPDAVSRRIFVSFSETINQRSPQIGERIQAVPADRLLVETDLSRLNQVDVTISKVIRRVAIVRQWTITQVIETTTANAHRFYSMGGIGGTSSKVEDCQ